jgi:acyl-CoA thioester hydrolase
MDGYADSVELRIDWSEMDLFGHVNNLAILKYIQSARVRFLENTGMMQLHAETGVGPILVSTSCQFKKQLHYPGHVTIYSKVESVKNTSFQMRFTVFNEANELIAEAHDVLVIYDYGTNTKHAIPDGIRERIKAL